MYSEVFSQVGKLSGLLPGKQICHRNHAGINLRAQWDPTSDECFIVGSLDEPRQVCFQNSAFANFNNGSILHN